MSLVSAPSPNRVPTVLRCLWIPEPLSSAVARFRNLDDLARRVRKLNVQAINDAYCGTCLWNMMDIQAVREYLLHRYPFCWLTGFSTWTRQAIEAIKNVTINEPFFNGRTLQPIAGCADRPWPRLPVFWGSLPKTKPVMYIYLLVGTDRAAGRVVRVILCTSVPVHHDQTQYPQVCLRGQGVGKIVASRNAVG